MIIGKKGGEIERLKSNINPYGNGGASTKIISILKEVNINSLLKKRLFNIDFNF